MEHGSRVDINEQVNVLGISFKELLGTIDARIVDKNVELNGLRQARDL
jgi:hypothetical protein